MRAVAEITGENAAKRLHVSIKNFIMVMVEGAFGTTVEFLDTLAGSKADPKGD